MVFKELSLELVKGIKSDYPSLKTLNLSGNHIEKFENLELLDTLINLDVSNNRITGSLVGLNWLRNLETINLANNRINSLDGISKLSNLRSLNLSGNKIERIEDLQKLKHNVNLRELNLTKNPIVAKIADYRDVVWDILPNLRSLDSIPVVVKDSPKKAPLASKRKEIEEIAEKFINSKGGSSPSFIKRMTELRKISEHSPKHTGSNEYIKELVAAHRRQTSGSGKINNETSREMQSYSQMIVHDKSLNTSSMTMSKPPAPIVNLDNGKKNDESGLFTFMHNNNLENPKYEPILALKEIINIQESYISKKSVNVGVELLKKWRNKVFELLFENKKNEILFDEKYKRLMQEKQQISDELDNAIYLKSITDQDLKQTRFELLSKTEELDNVLHSLQEKETVHYDVNSKLTELENMKIQVKSMVQQFNQHMVEEQTKINDAMFNLNSYHKRLVICQKRIKTWVHLWKSDKMSYIEKYKQVQRDMKNLRDKAIEERDIEIITLNHKMKLDIETLKKQEELLKAETDRRIQDANQKVSQMQSNNDAIKSDNERLLTRIRELEKDNIKLQTDLMTQSALKSSDFENAKQRYESMISQRDDTIKKLKDDIDDFKHNETRFGKRMKDIEQSLLDAKETYEQKIQSIMEQWDSIIADKNKRIELLEEENKQAQAMVTRRSKFNAMLDLSKPFDTMQLNQSSDALNTGFPNMMSSFPQFDLNQNLEPINQTNLQPFNSMDSRRSQDFAELNTPKSSNSMNIPPNTKPLSGTKENPVELKPVRITSTSVDFDSIQNHVGPKFPIGATQAQPISNPSNNPFYSGTYHGPRVNMMSYVHQGTQPFISTPHSSEGKGS